MARKGLGGGNMKKRIATSFGVAAIFAVIAMTQTSIEFDAASVKPASPSPMMAMAMNRDGGPGTANPGQITYRNAPLRALLEDAYRVQNHQLVGPGWLDTARFDVLAKVPAGATKEQAGMML